MCKLKSLNFKTRFTLGPYTSYIYNTMVNGKERFISLIISRKKREFQYP